jgi:membrane protease YdiL (CAAX protease family)
MQQKKMSVIGKIWWVIYPALLYLGVSLVCQFLVSIVVTIIAFATGSITPGSTPDTSFDSPLMQTIIFISTILSGVITIFLGIIFIRHDRKAHGLVRDKMQPSSALSWVTIVIISVCMLWISAGVTGLLEDYSPAHHQTIEMLQSMGRGYYVIFAVILAPLSEEIICRGLIFKRMRSFMGFLPAGLISGAVFGVMHGNIIQGLYATLIGVIFAYIYEKKQSLIATIIAHFIVNGSNAALTFLPEKAAHGFSEFYQGNNMLIITIVSVVICAGGMFLLTKTFKNIPAWQVKTDV